MAPQSMPVHQELRPAKSEKSYGNKHNLWVLVLEVSGLKNLQWFLEIQYMTVN